MTTRILGLIGFGTALLFAADEPGLMLQVSHTERAEFPSGGTLKLDHLTGVLTVEAWDQPGVEITTIKSLKPGYDSAERDKATHEMENLHVKVERSGNEVVITTDSPKHSGSGVEYRIKVPSTARLIVNHRVGEVNVDGLAGDIEVTLHRGEIFLHLPQDGRYNISAKCDLGAVNSDYPGTEKRLRWFLGHQIENGDSSAPHKLNLKVGLGFGDIVILKTQAPKAPGSLIAAPKANGL